MFVGATVSRPRADNIRPYDGGDFLSLPHSFLELGDSYSFYPKLTAVFTSDCLPAGTPAEKKAMEKSDYILIRVLGGFGTLKSDSGDFILEENCLLLLENRDEKIVFPREDINYILFYFESDKQPPCIRKNQRYIIPRGGDEMNILSLLYGETTGDSKLSTSIHHTAFKMLCLNFAQSIGKSEFSGTPYREDILKAAEYIRNNLGESISMAKLASDAGIAERNFRKMFTLEMGVSPKAYFQQERLREACRLLADRTLSIGLISDNLGYYSQFQFSRSFKKAFGMTPSEYRMSNAVLAKGEDRAEFSNINK